MEAVLILWVLMFLVILLLTAPPVVGVAAVSAVLVGVLVGYFVGGPPRYR